MPELISPRRRRTFTKAMGERKEHGGMIIVRVCVCVFVRHRKRETQRDADGIGGREQEKQRYLMQVSLP